MSQNVFSILSEDFQPNTSGGSEEKEKKKNVEQEEPFTIATYKKQPKYPKYIYKRQTYHKIPNTTAIGQTKQRTEISKIPKINANTNEQYTTAKNDKTLLCKSLIEGRECCYGNKCAFAHSLEEQIKFKYREEVYNIIFSVLENKPLKGITIETNNEKFYALVELTEVCQMCLEKRCIGGFNCRSGVCKQQYQVCYDDLMTGNCSFTGCPKVHLVRNGLQIIKHVKQPSQEYKQFKLTTQHPQQPQQEPNEKNIVPQMFFRIHKSVDPPTTQTPNSDAEEESDSDTDESDVDDLGLENASCNSDCELTESIFTLVSEPKQNPSN